MMKLRYIRYIGEILSLLMGVVLVGCNDEVFIDAEPLPDSSEITIEGDGGSWSTIIPRDGLIKVSMSNPYRDTKGYVTYYDKNSDPVAPDCPISDLAGIEFENPAQRYHISLWGKKLEINSYYNSYPPDVIILTLEYDYGTTKEIRINFTEGKPLEFFPWYEGEMTVEENIEEFTHRTSFTNNSSLTQKFEVYPYINCNCSHEVIPAEPWANKFKIDSMALPCFTGDWWELSEMPDIYLGDRKVFSPSRYVHEHITVDVPPYKKAVVYYTLHYSRASQLGKFFIYNEVEDRQFELGFTSKATYATHYEYTVEIE